MVKINSQGARELLRDPAVRAILRLHAGRVAGRASIPTRIVEDTTDRARAAVVASGDPRETRVREARDGDLARALGGA
ncbi:hypothetical protein [Paraoerskovia sediminicola]|uniref:hypothetical protein n=1 Tax=Paraoerskovia sediminicola TaxID=1138587 RepID=UPI0025734ADB|nr:hypothetical protein [Paraoerskovia sediminicola]